MSEKISTKYHNTSYTQFVLKNNKFKRLNYFLIKKMALSYRKYICSIIIEGNNEYDG